MNLDRLSPRDWMLDKAFEPVRQRFFKGRRFGLYGRTQPIPRIWLAKRRTRRRQTLGAV